MAEKATFKQCKALWSFCSRCGSENANWSELAKKGSIDKNTASEIISAIMRYYAGERGSLVGLLETMIQGTAGLPNFKVVDKGQSLAPQTGAEPIEEEETTMAASPSIDKEKGKAGEELSKMIDGLAMVLNPAMVGKLNNTVQAVIEEEKQDLIVALDEAMGNVAAMEKQLAEKGTVLPSFTPVGDGYIKPAQFDLVARLVEGRQNVLLWGPAGPGKSRMAREVAMALGMPFFKFSFSGGMRFSQVFGSTVIQDNGSTKWVPGPLLEAIQCPQVGILEEIFSCDPDVLLGLNSVLEKSEREIMTPIGIIKVHPDFRFIACANTPGRSVSRQYTGAQRADDSLLSRFGAKIHVGYDLNVEKAFLAQVGSIADREFFAGRLSDIRDKAQESNMPVDFGTRELIACLDNYRLGIDKETAFDLAFLGGLSRAERAKLGV